MCLCRPRPEGGGAVPTGGLKPAPFIVAEVVLPVSVVHDVPMCRQLISESEWDQHDGPALGDRLEWSNRACGMAALRMILLAHHRPAPTVTELCHLGVARDALTPRGWLHAGIAALASEFGVPGHAESVAPTQLLDRITTGPVIISVTEQFPTDGRRGGHLVVARGFDDSPDPMIAFHDPSAWGQSNQEVSLSRLTSSYSGRAITFTNPQRAGAPA